ncbi:PQQ-binding-like beta-propeller repeat protein [Haloarchaeobius sp. DYHT-AS-18]|uniref:outer membrane protein assembly factor BamB family protein n=1 Tax=Haloarchaeobius sp. DYHT-AS-18 TaxID=3446117 RepID=UPI003EBD5342
MSDDWLSRREILLVGGGAALAGHTFDPSFFAGGADATPGSASAPWPTAGGSHRRDGYTDATLGDQFETVWTQRVGGGSIRRSLVVGNDVVVTADYDELVAVDARTGAQRWTTGGPKRSMYTDGTTGGPSRSMYTDRTPALSLVDGTVVAVDGNTLFGVESASGTVEWVRRGIGFGGIPVGDVLLSLTARDGLGAYDAPTGLEHWHIPFSDPNLSPVVCGDDGRVVCLISGGDVAVVDVASETVTARTTGVFEDGWKSSHAYRDGMAFLLTKKSGHDPLVAFDTDSGEVRWRRPDWESAKGTGSSLAVDGETVYLPGHGERSRQVLALDAADGSERWVQELDTSAPSIRPVCTDDRLFVHTGENLVILDTETGRIRNRIALSAAGSGSLAVAHGRLYVTAGNTLRAMEVL